MKKRKKRDFPQVELLGEKVEKKKPEPPVNKEIPEIIQRIMEGISEDGKWMTSSGPSTKFNGLKGCLFIVDMEKGEVVDEVELFEAEMTVYSPYQSFTYGPYGSTQPYGPTETKCTAIANPFDLSEQYKNYIIAIESPRDGTYIIGYFLLEEIGCYFNSNEADSIRISGRISEDMYVIEESQEAKEKSSPYIRNLELKGEYGNA